MENNVGRTDETKQAKPHPTGALLLAIYRDDLRATVADAERLDPLVKAAALEMAGIMALYEGRHRAARHCFDRADSVLIQSGRVPPARSAA